MKSFTVLAALVAVATAAPTAPELGLKHLPQHRKVTIREKKSPTHGLLHSQAPITGVVPVVGGFQHGLPAHHGIGHHHDLHYQHHQHGGLFRSEEESLGGDSKEKCAKEVESKCGQKAAFKDIEENASKPDSLDQGMESNIKMARVAVENMHRNLEEMEDSSNARTKWKHADSKSDLILHENIEMARQALEHVETSFANMQSLNHHSATLKEAEVDVHDSSNKDFVHMSEQERMTQWKEAIENIERNVEIANNIKESFKSAQLDDNIESSHVDLARKNEDNEMRHLAISHTNMVQPESQIKETKNEKMQASASMSHTTMVKPESHIKETKNEKEKSASQESHDLSQKTLGDQNHLTTPQSKPVTVARVPELEKHIETEKNIEKPEFLKSAEVESNKRITIKSAEPTLMKTEKPTQDHMVHHEHLDQLKSASDHIEQSTLIPDNSHKKDSIVKLENNNQAKASENIDINKSDMKSAVDESNSKIMKTESAETKKHLENQSITEKSSIGEFKAADNLLHPTANGQMNHQSSSLAPQQNVQEHNSNVAIRESESGIVQTKTQENLPKKQRTESDINNFHKTLMKSNDHLLTDDKKTMEHSSVSTMHAGVSGKAAMDEQFTEMSENTMTSQFLPFPVEENMNRPQFQQGFGRSAYGPSVAPIPSLTYGGGAASHASGVGASTAGSSGAVGVFPNANVGGCAVPLLLSCSPSVVSGSLAKAHPASYSAPAYRANKEFNFHNKRNTEIKRQSTKLGRIPKANGFDKKF